MVDNVSEHYGGKHINNLSSTGFGDSVLYNVHFAFARSLDHVLMRVMTTRALITVG